MLTDWIHWLSSLGPDRSLALLGSLLLLDGPRYALSKVVMCLWDWGRGLWDACRGVPAAGAGYGHCPSVCVVLAGYNEAQTIEATLNSVWGTYPRLEVVVVDDGSTDGTEAVARRFARGHPGVLVLTRPERGGKASAINFALRYTRAEVIVIADTDSHLDRAAIWEVVQPLEDPGVGAVSATVLARNPFDNLVTWLQAQEYLHGIFVGRMVSARLGILPIASGGFSAFRRSAVDRVGGWDVGPGEDGDITLRVRKAGYEIAFAPYAQCYTNLPTTWWGLFKQRRRWNRGAVRYKCRKHIDMGYVWSRNFRVSDFCVLLNAWVFQIALLYGSWIYLVGLCLSVPEDLGWVVLTGYVFYLASHLVQALTVLYYSSALARDALICTVLPLVPFYQLFQKVARVVSVTEEIFLRKSFEDNYVPARVREATWHW